MKKAEITAFLSLVFVLLVSFVLGMLEITVIHTAGNLSRLAVDRAVFSVFGEYQRNLLEDYHIFSIEGSYGTGDFSEERLTSRMHYYGSSGIGHEITAIQYLTDNRGQAFREQVLEYMEDQYGIGLIRDFTGLTGKWEEESIQGQKMEEAEETILHGYEEIKAASEAKETEGSAVPADDGQDGNPFGFVEQIRKSGLLSLVMPKDMELSGLQIRPEEQASHRQLRTGRGSFPMRQSTGVEDRLLYDEYVLRHFSSAAGLPEGSTSEDFAGRSLAYEVEYIIEGKSSDKENLESVLGKIFLVRMALNYGYLLGDSGKKAEASALALTITALLLIPEMWEAAEQLILLAWAAGESIVDIRTLLSGEKAPLIKNARNWQLPLSSLLIFGSGSEDIAGTDVEDGISYQEYLRAFLFLKDPDEVTMRTLDRIEENLASEHGLKYFRADQCITRTEIQNTAEILGGITYTFPVWFGYG
ncbi:DUF5702 domain-containing protein [Clostridium sp. Marseille-P3244]|uniref:DUF5702 domain-containing protein n=1 Tax=Clostridium sp. Marseille-P3244 TaxID=1871020 RepID=UPI000A7911D8|nr:DUF5702 domain-containing protein [Clostridium sp. Marseille-P3244]